MASGKFVTYLRVSTHKQGADGLGIDAQRAAVAAYLNGGDWAHLREYVEVESGADSNRPELAKALKHARQTGATLLIAKLDRLSRSVGFIANLMDAGVKFVAADNPTMNELTIHIIAAVAQAERKAISERTKAALQAAKARGVKLGNPNGAMALNGPHNRGRKTIKAKADAFAAEMKVMIEEIKAEGHLTLAAIADELNTRGILTARDGQWHSTTVKNVLDR